MRDYLELGCTPAEESCEQVGTENYDNSKARKEAERYRDELRLRFPDVTIDNNFAVKSFPHDFGYYFEVVVYFHDSNEDSVNFAFKVERNLPMFWMPEVPVIPAEDVKSYMSKHESIIAEVADALGCSEDEIDF